MISSVEHSIIVYENGSIIGKKIKEFDNLEYVHISLGSNCKMEKHTLPMNVDFFVISGSGKINVGDTVTQLKKGDLLRVKKNILRALFTNDKENMTVLVIKSL